MTPIDRRRLMILAASSVAAARPAAAADAPAYPQPAPVASNPHAARAHVFTIVTPDMDASIRFYRELMGYAVIGQGVLAAGAKPAAPGRGQAGRRYALIRPHENQVTEYGVVRLLEAPSGAAANRPRPGARITDPGLAVMECLTNDYRASYDSLTKAGVKTLSPPLYYGYRDIKLLPGATPRKSSSIDVRSYSAFGPAGEQMFISCGVDPVDHETIVKLRPIDGPHSPYLNFVVVSLNRWPVWYFYKAVFGMTPVVDTYTNIDNVSTLTGAPAGTTFNYGQLGDGLNMEWWEYFAVDPRTAVTYPTALDRTGLAMVTFRVDDLAAVRARTLAAGVAIIGEGALPLPAGEKQDGFHIRGPVGELIEIVGRG